MTDAILEVSGVYKSFGALAATRDCNLVVDRGEIHALIGPNGAGKTTLVGQVSGDFFPDRGEIRFDGRDITRTSIQERVELGLIRSFQIPSVFGDWTVLQNVFMAVQVRRGHSFRFWREALSDSSLLALVRESLEQMNLWDRAQARVCDLAHGEIRQLELAMSLALSPKLILLDEPMAGMGRSDSKNMAALLQQLRKSVTMLLIEHDMDVVFSLSDRVTVMAQGNAFASGTPEEIRNNSEVRQIYLGKKE